MSAHTPGRLVVGDRVGNRIQLKHTNGDVPGAISLVLAQVTACQTWRAEAEANARRLAACWNACESMTIDEIEGHGGLIAGLAVGVSAAAAQRIAGERADSRAIEANYEAARALLAAVLKEADDDIAAIVLAGIRGDRPIVKSIRQFLEPKP